MPRLYLSAVSLFLFAVLHLKGAHAQQNAYSLCRAAQTSEQKISACSAALNSRLNADQLERILLRRGNAFVELGQMHSAIADFSRLIEMKPYVAGYIDNRLYAFLKLGQNDEALADANRSIMVAPNQAFVYRSRAMVYAAKGNFSAAVKDADTALVIDPTNVGLVIDRSGFKVQAGNAREALSELSRVLDLYPNNVTALKNRAVAYRAIGDLKSATKDLIIARQLAPNDSEIIDALVSTQNSVGLSSNSILKPSSELSAPSSEVLGGVALVREGGTFKVPGRINGVLDLHFIVDSGAADVSLPADVVLTLVRSGTINDSDFVGEQTFVLADGSSVKSKTFRIRQLSVGGRTIENVLGSIVDVNGSLLLGQSFLSRFKRVSFDYGQGFLVLE